MAKHTPIGRIVFLSLASFFSIFPFYWMIASATNQTKDITMGKLTFGSHLLENTRNAFSHADLFSPFLNSMLLAVVITVLSLVICGIAGYAFILFPSRKRDALFTILIASMMVPFAVKIIPMFRFFASVGLINSFWAIILPAVGTPFVIFFFRQNSVTFPVDTIHAARVDGLGEFSIFFRIYTPIMRPTYAAAGIFVFMATWNNYLWPLIVIQSNDKYTMPLAVANLAAEFNPDYGMVMIGIIVSTLPTVLVFFLLQKSFVEGIVGSVKG